MRKFLLVLTAISTMLAAESLLGDPSDLSRPKDQEARHTEQPQGEGSGPCPEDTENTMFASTAHPLHVESCTTDFGLWTLQSFHFQEGTTPLMDLNGNGAPEILLEFPYHDYSIDDGHSGEYNRPMLIARSGEQVGHIDISQVLDISPNSISYNGLNWPPKGNPNLWFIAECKGFFDVTGDGRLDIILDVQLNIEWNPGEWTEIRQFFYIENTSSPVAAACSSDIDDSGAVDISDLLTVISDWGPCEGG